MARPGVPRQPAIVPPARGCRPLLFDPFMRQLIVSRFPMQITIDHATVCGPKLASLQKALAEAGLATDYGGPHTNGATHMALLGFEDGSYLELIAPIEPDRVEASPWGKLMLTNAGAGAWAVGTTDIQGEVARLKLLKIDAAGPEAGSRKRTDGKLLEWETASAGPGTMGSLLPFMIQDHTPREWRVQRSASTKGSGLTGIAAVVLAVKNIDAAAALFRQAYGWDAAPVEDHTEFGAKVAHFPGTPVMLASPLRQDSWLAARLAKFGEIPAAFLLRTDNLERAAQRFHLPATENWFGRTLAWFDPDKLQGINLGLAQY
jgi:hypothetical protein